MINCKEDGVNYNKIHEKYTPEIKEEGRRIVMNTLGVNNEEILAHLMLIEQMLHTIGYKSGIKFETDLITKALKENFEEIERQKKEQE